MTIDQYSSLLDYYKMEQSGRRNEDMLKENILQAKLLKDKQKIMEEKYSDTEEFISELETLLYGQ